MDAVTARALAVVLRLDLPTALKDALREMERARMAAADLEARSQGLVAALHFNLVTLDRLDLPETDSIQQVQVQVLDMRNMSVAGLQSAGLDHIVAMADEEADAMEDDD